MPMVPAPSTACDALIVIADELTTKCLADRLGVLQRTLAGRYAVTLGGLAGTRVAIAHVAAPEVLDDAVRIIAAAHAPKCVIGACQIIAVAATTDTITVDTTPSSARSPWQQALTDACRAINIRSLQVTLTHPPHADEAARVIERTRRGSAARKLGVWVGALWRKPSTVVDLGREQLRQLDRATRLAEKIAAVLGSSERP